MAGETGYRIDRSTNNGSTWTTAGTVGAGFTTFTDTGLTEATSYTYRVVATNAAGDSAPSTTRSTITLPSAPTGLTATAVSGGQINLSWVNHSSVASNYYIEQSTDGTTWQPIASPYGSSTNNYTATRPFDSSTTYHFRVRAHSYTGADSAYATAFVTTPAFPSQTTINSATAQSDTSVALTWTDVTGETGYRIDRSTNNGSTWTTAGTVGAGFTTFTDTGLTEATSYTYRVVATNAEGDSAPSTTRSTMTRPAAPTAVSASVISAEQVNVSWTDQSTGEIGYRIEQATSPQGPWTVISSAGVNITSISLTGPFNGNTTYYFRVLAYNAGGDSSPAIGSATSPDFPNAPSGLTVTSLSTSQIDLSWDGDPAASSYKVFRRTGTGAWVELGTVASGVISYTDTTVIAGSIYTYGVATVNGTSMSGRSPIGPALAQNGSSDEDEDGLTNLQEANLGTNPTYFDTDGDLLPDQWETLYSSFDPKSPDPTQGDADGDGLTNFVECTLSTDPDSDDTDGDGVSDADEVNSGADPTNPNDGGKAPADDMKAEFQLTTGDPSGSRSERWELQVGGIKYQSPSYGVVGSASYFYKTGETYEIRMKHIGTDPGFLAQADGPNYDWTASVSEVGSSLPYWIDDQGNLLRTYISDVIGPPNLVDGKTSYLYIPQLDADIDSDNNNGFDPPDRSDEEDRLEGKTDGAKILTANTGDVDGDGVPDYADFDGIDGKEFVPLVISLSSNLQYADLSKIEYTFTYDASDATADLRSGSGTADDPYVYTRPSGSLRIWTKNAGESRDRFTDFINSGQKISAEDLGLEPGGSVTIYVEAVAGSTSYLPVEVSANVTGNKWSGTLTDKVYFASTETRFDLVEDDGSLTPVDEIPISYSAPTFSDVSFQVVPGSLRVGSDGSTILVDLMVSGSLDDAASDLIPGDDGIIPAIDLFLNGEDTPLTSIATDVSKATDGLSLLKPYNFSATFSTILSGVVFQPGSNLLHLSATNTYGISGYAEGTIDIDVQPPTIDDQGTVGLGVAVRLEFSGDPATDSTATVSASYQLGDGTWSQPITLEQDPNGPEGVIRFTDGTNTIDLSETAAFDPQTADQYSVVITLPAAALVGITLTFVESGANTKTFESAITLDEYDLYGYAGFQLSVGGVSDIDVSGPGDFHPIVMEIVGPQQLLETLQDVSIQQETDPDQPSQEPRKPEKYLASAIDGRVYLTRPGSTRPEVMLAMPSARRSTAPVQAAPRRDGVWNFAQGVGAGLLDTGFDLWDGAVSVISGTWYYVKNYNPVSNVYRYFTTGSSVIVEDQIRAYEAWDTAEAIAGFIQKIFQDQQDYTLAVLTGNDAEINRLGEEYSKAFEYSLEIIQAIRDEVLNMDAYDGGRIVGRVIGEMIVTLASVGIGSALKSTSIAQVITKLKGVSYIADAAPVVNKLDNVADVARRSRPRRCASSPARWSRPPTDRSPSKRFVLAIWCSPETSGPANGLSSLSSKRSSPTPTACSMCVTARPAGPMARSSGRLATPSSSSAATHLFRPPNSNPATS